MGIGYVRRDGVRRRERERGRKRKKKKKKKMDKKKKKLKKKKLNQTDIPHTTNNTDKDIPE